MSEDFIPLQQNVYPKVLEDLLSSSRTDLVKEFKLFSYFIKDQHIRALQMSYNILSNGFMPHEENGTRLEKIHSCLGGH